MGRLMDVIWTEGNVVREWQETGVGSDAISQRKRADLVFGMLKMTEVAGTFGHLDMRPNDDLGVTASTTELLAPT